MALLSLTIAPARLPRPLEDPIPRGDLALPDPPGPVWVKKRFHTTALRVRLNGLGARTHANWVLFRLPFDASQTRTHIRAVDFSIQQAGPTHVGAFTIGSICTKFPALGTVANWTSYTTSGLGWTQKFAWHLAPPTDDPTILGLNVPTRVANYVACGWDDGHLSRAEDWSLDVSWEER